jgi:tRNA A-37 threonylcarbamoyl transferase component Bud32
MDGTENIITEDLEPFNNITNNDDYENFSFLEENINENNLIKGPLITDTNILPKEDIKMEDIKINKNNNKNNKNKPSSLHIKKKLPKLYINNDKKDDNQIKTNFYNSFICSPSRMSEGKFFMNSQTRLTTLNQKINDNLPKKRKSLTKKKKKEKNNDKSDDSKESKLKRKIIYSKKIIDSLNKFKNNKNNDLELKNKENFPISASNLNLDIIFENKNLLNAGTHHYLINTVSTKNKMVQKKINSFEQNKNALNTFNKVSTICLDNDTYDTNINLCRRTIFRLNRTPKIKKKFKAKERFSFNNTINNNSTRNNLRKYSFRLNRELSLENNLSGMSTMINSKIFNGKLDDYLITKELGKGSYAVVKLATHKITKNKYAIKIYSKQSLIDPQKRNTVKNEINILKQIDNENIMKLYEVIDTPSNLYLVLEYINGINLLEIIKNEKFHFIKEQRAKKIFLQVVKGISYCHKKNIFHRDIKLENILVLKDDTIKIIDFGFGIKCNKDMYQKLFCGTPSYMPPEIVKKEKYIACYSDIWSLGVLFYAMLYGIFPFKGKDDDDLFEKINEAQIIFPEYNLISDKIKELFGKIFVVNPTQRVSLDDMINILEE